MWNAYRKKYGSLNIGRRIEQGVGNLYSLYFNGKVDEDKRVDARIFMPHEEVPETTFEEERMKALKKKSG
ncbi:MAG: hypothetical protein RR939_11775 [Acinetobacter sp.]